VAKYEESHDAPQGSLPYQRHDFLAERQAALGLWGAHVRQLVGGLLDNERIALKRVA
jgi:hypothetical protein